jgi:hypothetical protein
MTISVRRIYILPNHGPLKIHYHHKYCTCISPYITTLLLQALHVIALHFPLDHCCKVGIILHASYTLQGQFLDTLCNLQSWRKPNVWRTSFPDRKAAETSL